jgi:hypothetical protein
MKLFKSILLLALSSTLSVSPAHADFVCETPIIRLLVYADGGVNLLTTARGDYTVICNLSTPWKGVDVTSCAAWVSILQSIKRRNGIAVVYYGGTGSCATLPTYGAAPAPVYVGDATP